MKSRTIVVAVALSITAAAGAFAHGGATGVVKERMDAMTAMSKVMKALTPMMRGQITFDENAVRDGAARIGDHAKTITALFPEGSGGHPSEARGEVWSDWAVFEALAQRLETLAVGLEAAAGNPPAMGDQGMMGQGMGDGQNMMSGGSMMGQGMMNGQSGMDTGSMMGGNMPLPDADALAAMPVDGVFNMVAQTCSSCHTRFRQEEK